MAVPFPVPAQEPETVLSPAVLLVEDCDLTARRISDLVKRTGFDCGLHHGKSVEDALDMLHHLPLLGQRVVLVLLDIELEGGQDGLALLRELKADPAHADTPVVLLTSTIKRIHEGLAMGAKYFLTKESVGQIPDGVVAQLEVILREQAHSQMLRDEALIDAKSGLGNDRKFADTLYKEFSMARRLAEQMGQPAPLSLLLMDADRFKQINDTKGHQIGDRVIRIIGEVLKDFRRRELRVNDVPCRVGGDEFALILPNTTQEGAVVVAARWWRRVTLLNRRLKEVIPTPETLEDADGNVLTFSMGVASLYPPPRCKDTELERLYQRADQAMYAAKHLAGGHCAAIFDVEKSAMQESMPLWFDAQLRKKSHAET